MVFIKGVRDFKAYQEAYKLALEVRPLCRLMHKTEQFGGIADQLRRCSAGICANLAEGFGKNQAKAELRRYVRIALGSAHEADFWLEIARDDGHLESTKCAELRNRYQLVCRLLKGFEDSISVNRSPD